MTVVRAFQAVLYNDKTIGDMSQVICPPYDVISPDQQNMLLRRHPQNFIHILLGKDKAGDDRRENKYTRAKTLFDQWLADGVLKQDEKPALYFYRQEFRVMGSKHTRTGFIGLMKLPDAKHAKVYPHENTHAEAKEDRFRLWSTVGAALSPIFVCFSDRERKVEKIFSRDIAPSTPVVDVTDDNDVRHILWRLDDPDLITEITESIGQQDMFIADGHHRYEVAKQYRQHCIDKAGKADANASYQYVMTYFTNLDSRDLQIFPMHRLVKQLPGELDFLEEYFRMDKIKTKDELLIMVAKAGRNEHAFGLYARDELWLLRLKNKLLIDQTITEGSPDFRRLDATILKHFVFDRVGLASEDIEYTSDAKYVMDSVDEGTADVGFLMNPVKIEQLRNIALGGERMPPKTTYFYPKVASGLTTYKW